MKKTAILGIAVGLGLVSQAAVKLPAFLTDNMVVQRNSTFTFKGSATPGSTVTIQAGWKDKPVTVKCDMKGEFTAPVATPDAGGPYTIVISDGNGAPAVLTNVLSGEVWLCSGQSNMEFPVKGWTQVMNADEVVATARHPEIRLLQIRKNIAYTPQADAAVNMGGWVEASPATMDFSAIAYFFATILKDELDVPVGVIDATWGGTPAEAWTPLQKLAGISGFEPQAVSLTDNGDNKAALQADYEAELAKWNARLADGVESFDLSKIQNGTDWGKMPVPGMWEYSVLPEFDGIVWLQRTVNLPADAAGKEGEIFLGPVDNEDETYINGVKVGGNGAWDLIRHYSIGGGILKEGENVITVRVADYDGEGGIGGSADTNILVAGDKRYPLAGEWNYRVAKDFSTLPPRPAPVESSSYPTVLYNAMISPLNIMPVRGVLWYQGCANVGRAEQYEPLFQNLITGWREHWNAPELPFYFVQLAGWLKQKNVQPDSQWAALRDSQAKALSLPATGMAVAIDLGNPADIHPVNKQEVARRLSLLALNRIYGKTVTDAAPVCTGIRTNGNKLILTFDGPVTGDASIITGFIVGDKDGNFAYATTRRIDSMTLELSSPLIADPTVARYNWADSPGGNLRGNTGLPVAPFATDK